MFRTFTQREVKNLVALAIMSEAIGDHDPKPIFRTDPGSPNMAADIRIFLRQIGVVFSPGLVARPTDNARQERFYRSLKQEEVTMVTSLRTAQKQVSVTGLTTTMKSGGASRCSGINRRLFTAVVTRPDFWKIIGATSRRPRGKEDMNGYLIIRN